MILDTNALSAFAEGNKSLGVVLAKTPEHHLPVIVLGEFRYGLMRSRGRRLLESWLDQREKEFGILDVDKETAHVFARVKEELRAQGNPIPENDIWIAALALQHRQPIVSQDAHFDFVTGLRRIHW